MTLREVPAGRGAYIDRLTVSSGLRRRLLDLGLTRGAHVRCLYSAPGGGLRAYLVRGAVIALRAEDAALIGCEGRDPSWD